MLGFGWPRALPQGYNYIYNKRWLLSNFQKNSMSWGITLGWGLSGCARGRKVTVIVTIKLNWVLIFKRI